MDRHSTSDNSIVGSLQSDSDDRMIYDEATLTVKAATLPALVENLTRHDILNVAFNRAILTTYRSFTTADEFFACLVDRFQVKPDIGLNNTQLAEWIEHTKALIQLRVINILKQWLGSFWMEPNDDTARQLLLRIKSFVQQNIVAVDKTLAGQLVVYIESHISGNAHYTVSQAPIVNAPKPLLPKKLQKIEFLKVNAVEMARQLTAIESCMFGKVHIRELANQAWQKKASPGCSEQAPNVRALIRYSNQLSNWVGALVLEHSDLKKRAAVIGHLILIADACQNLQNYSAVVAIIYGLHSAPVYRLDRTWSQVSERACDILDPLRKLTSSEQNFGVYRELLRNATPPCIPFLGLYLKDLTFIQDGNKSFTPEGLVNIQKCVMLEATIHEALLYKNTPYSLYPVPQLQEFIATGLQTSPDLYDMWEQSRRLEPRGRGDEKAHGGSYASTGSAMSAMVIASLAMDE